jgi:hypothetical protein
MLLRQLSPQLNQSGVTLGVVFVPVASFEAFAVPPGPVAVTVHVKVPGWLIGQDELAPLPEQHPPHERLV